MYKAVAAFLRRFVNAIFRIEVVNPQNMPESGACVVCINHISSWDPLVIGVGIKRRIRFLAKNELFKIPLVGWFLKCIDTIPIKREAGDFAAIKESLRLLKNGGALGIFPTGTRERVHKNAPAKSGAALIAAKSGAPVIPIYIKTNYRLFSAVKIIVGSPLNFSSEKGSYLSQERLSEMADSIYSSILKLGDEG